MSKRILIVEDDLPLAKVLSSFLNDEGFITQVVSTGAEALLQIKQSPPEMVPLDLGLPDTQGETILVKVRQSNPDLPVVILTAKSRPQEIAAGLNLGADDYLAKPFDSEELLARINARLRINPKNKDIIELGPLVLNLSKKTVKRSSKDIVLTKTEFELLEFLIQHAGKVINREAILNAVWGFSPNVESRVVDIYIGYLRKKIDQGFKRKLINNKRGFGYLIDL